MTIDETVEDALARCRRLFEAVLAERGVADFRSPEELDEMRAALEADLQALRPVLRVQLRLRGFDASDATVH
jgi:hypothetical protein